MEESDAQRASKSPLASYDARLHDQEPDEDGDHVDVEAVSQDAVTLDRGDLLREPWQQ